MAHRYLLPLTVLMLLVGISSGHAHTGAGPTTLWPGEIVITGYDATAPTDSALMDLAAGTQTRFTDNGWKLAGGFRAGEEVAVYTAPAADVAKGTVVTYRTNAGSFVTTAPRALDPARNQLLAYQGTDAAPAFLTGVTYPQVWSDATTTNSSALPTGLVAGTSALTWPNAQHLTTAARTGLPIELRTAASAVLKWAEGTTSPTLSQTQFVVSEGLVPDATELAALRALYTSTNGANWANRTNWLTGTTLAEAATWYGVMVQGGDVQSLNLGQVLNQSHIRMAASVTGAR